MSDTGFILAEGQTTFDSAASALSRAHSILGLPDHVTLRVVAYEATAGEWWPFARSCWLGLGEPGKEADVIKLDRLRLVALYGDSHDVADADALREFFGTWRALIGERSQPVGFTNSVQVYRQWSANPWIRIPCWTFQLRESETRPYAGSPRGPFFNAEYDFLADSIEDAAAEWLREPTLRTQASPRDGVQIIVPDPRAYISHVARDEDTLEARIERSSAATQPRDYFCAMISTDYDGRRVRSRAKFDDGGSARLVLPGAVRMIRLFIVDDSGYCYDQFYEDERGPSWGASVLFPERNIESVAHASLLDALNKGESEHLEAKEWLPPERSHKKSYELLKTVCAYANTDGGAIFVGVSKELEIRDVSRALVDSSSLLLGRRSDDLAALRAAYAQELARIVRQGITPTVNIETEWIARAGHHVLRVNVPASEAAPRHYIVESNEAWVRRGANNKKMTPADIAQLIPDPGRQKQGGMRRLPW